MNGCHVLSEIRHLQDRSIFWASQGAGLQLWTEFLYRAVRRRLSGRFIWWQACARLCSAFQRILQQSRAERPLAEASPGLCCPSWSCTPTGRASACQRLMLVAAFQGLGAMLRFRQIVAQEQRRSCGPQPRKIPPRSAVMILQKTYLAGGGHSSMLRDMESTTPAKPLHNCQTSSCCHFSSQFLLFFRYSC